MLKTNVTKSVSSFQVYHVASSSSSSSSSSEEVYDTPLKRFNRLLRSSVARHWAYFRRERPGLKSRGRSVSDADISSIVDADFRYLELPVPQRRSYPVCNSATDPAITSTSAGGSSSAVGAEEASDGSDAERSRRHHLRVPTLSHSGHYFEGYWRICSYIEINSSLMTTTTTTNTKRSS